MYDNQSQPSGPRPIEWVMIVLAGAIIIVFAIGAIPTILRIFDLIVYELCRNGACHVLLYPS
jgi:hypothetical protein